MNIKEITKANKEAWNEVMPKHQKAAKKRLDELFQEKGFIYQHDKNLLEIFDRINLKDKDIVHLCCNNGSELLSIKNMGAGRCFGIDISDIAIEEAKERAEKSGINCEFIVSDVFEIDVKYHKSFDIAHITAGCLGWIPDLEEFFRIIKKLLRKNGIFIIHEIHPFSEMLPFDDNDIENKLQIVDSYYYNEAIVENGGLDYIGGTSYEGKPNYWFIHQISDIVLGLSKNEFKITEFQENENDISAGHRAIEEKKAGVPLSCIVVAEK